MPERVHKRFFDDSDQQLKGQTASSGKDGVPSGEIPGKADQGTEGDARKKGARKAPSQVARSNRRALKFKEKLGQGEPGTTLSEHQVQSLEQQGTAATEDSSRRFPPRENGHSTAKRHTASFSKLGEASRNLDGTASAPNLGNLKAKAASLRRIRQSLPIWPYAEQIRKSLRDRNVLLLVGETGSGKSTQVPQFLLSEPWCRTELVSVQDEWSSTGDNTKKTGKTRKTRKTRVGGCIAVTEPRRVAATTLARRVADEVGTPLGKASPASTVGYSVRFDDNAGPNTKIKFVTEGMLLQEMLRDPWLTRYSAVIVDEVHERGVNVDLLMGFLRRLLTRLGTPGKDGRGGQPLKVVVMSATAEGSELVKFFQEGFDGASPNTSDIHMQDESEDSWGGLSSSESDSKVHTDAKEEQDIPQSTSHVAALYFQGRQHPVKILHTPQPVPDVLEACIVRIFAINYQEPLPGDILVFLTGQKTVESLCALIEEYSTTLSKSVPKLLALPLFAALPQEAQRRVFEPNPQPAKGHRGVRKVIVSTNIAETSVTVSGVRYVLDGGKEKMKQFRPRIGLDSLLTKPISHSSAIQRAGRAGREAPGRCYRMYTEGDFEKLDERALPEILRCDLAQAVLALMARDVPAHEVGSFPLLTMPPREALKAALSHLHQLGAIDDDGHATQAGIFMAGLPVGVSMARALMKAADPSMSCLDDMIDLVSAMSGESIFLPGNEDGDDEADVEQKSRREEVWRRDGDHATMIMAVRGFALEHGDRRKWAEERGLSWRAMRGIMDIRKQLLALKPQLTSQTDGSDAASSTTDSTTPISPNVLRCLLAGFPLNAAILAPDGSYRTVAGRQAVAIHPSSVLFRRVAGIVGSTQGKPSAIVYTEFVYTTRAYARGVSAVEVDWIVEALGADWGLEPSNG